MNDKRGLLACMATSALLYGCTLVVVNDDVTTPDPLPVAIDNETLDDLIESNEEITESNQELTNIIKEGDQNAN